MDPLPQPPPEDPDLELVRRLQAGDAEALALAVVRFTPLLRSGLNGWIGASFSTEDRDEVISRTFLNCWRSVGRFRGDSKLVTWLHRIARNLTLNRIYYNRVRRAGHHCSIDQTFDDSATTYGDLLPDPGNFLDGLDVEERQQSIERAIERLEPRHRQIIDLRGRQNLEYTEIAIQLGCNLGTVKSRLARARDALRRLVAA